MIKGGRGRRFRRPVGCHLPCGDASTRGPQPVYSHVPSYGGDPSPAGVQQPDGPTNGSGYERPLAAEIERYLETDTASAEERVRIFRLAWDVCCSAFGTRQVLYERFFQGDAFRNVVLLNGLYDKEPMTQWVRDFLEQE